MPFTLFHFGPALFFGVPLRAYLHLPTFLAASVLIDIEPIIVIVLGLNYPLHGFLHTFLFASLAGLFLGFVMFALEGVFHPLFSALLLVDGKKLKMNVFMITGWLGTMLHVLLDSPMYYDIRPFYPMMINPLYNPDVSANIYIITFSMGLIGVIYYFGSMLLLRLESTRNKSSHRG